MQPYKKGSTLEQIIEDGWSSGFQISQTMIEIELMGYHSNLNYVRSEWNRMDKEFMEYIHEPAKT
jgi:hypothetical protein